jgi:hypothetical protein
MVDQTAPATSTPTESNDPSDPGSVERSDFVILSMVLDPHTLEVLKRFSERFGFGINVARTIRMLILTAEHTPDEVIRLSDLDNASAEVIDSTGEVVL